MAEKTARDYFYQAHGRVFGKLRVFAETQAGPNPLTDDERRAMAARWPERYGFMGARLPPKA